MSKFNYYFLLRQSLFYTLDFSWTAPASAPSNGYEWAYSTSPTSPSSGTGTMGLTASLTGLTSGTEYYLFVRSKCDAGLNSSWSSIGPIVTKLDCGDTFYDSGGDLADYSNLEDITTTICPSNADNAIVLTFTDFAIESDWDALYIYNDDVVNDSEIFDSGNGVTDAGFPAGGYYGSLNPGPFTSTDTTGCITARFRSDTYVTELGWEVDITCTDLCSGEVTNLLDDQWGSLRRAILCAEDDDVININTNLSGDTVVINSSIIIDKSLSINQTSGTMLYVKVIGDGPAFTVTSGKTLELKNVHIISGTQTNGRAIINNGTLKLEDVNIYDQINTSTGSAIQNNGTLEVSGTTNIIMD